MYIYIINKNITKIFKRRNLLKLNLSLTLRKALLISLLYESAHTIEFIAKALKGDSSYSLACVDVKAYVECMYRGTDIFIFKLGIKFRMYLYDMQTMTTKHKARPYSRDDCHIINRPLFYYSKSTALWPLYFEFVAEICYVAKN